MADSYKIELGVGLNNSDFNNIEQKIKSLEAEPIEIKISSVNAVKEIDTIQKLLQNLNKLGNTGATKVNLNFDDFLNELDKLKAGFKSAKAAKDEFNSSQNVASAVSSLKSEIAILQNASPSIKSFKTQIDGAEVSVESLLNDLKQVKTQGDFKVVENRFKAFGKAAEAAGIDLNEVDTKFEKLKSITKEIATLKIDIFKLDDKNDIAKAMIQLERLESEAAELRAEFQQDFPTVSLEQIDDIAKKGADALAKLQAQFAKGIKADFDVGNFDNQLSSIYDKYGKLRQENKELEADIRDVEIALKAMETAIGTGDEIADVEKLKTAYGQYCEAIKKVNNALAIQQREERAVNAAEKLVQDNASLKLDMQNWLKQNTKAAKDYGEQIKKLIASCDELDAVGNKNTRRAFNNIAKDAENAGKTGLSTWDKLVTKVKEYSVYLGAADIFMYAWRGLQDAFEQVKAIDTAMTELKKVTDETDASYNKFLTNAASRAKELGITIDGLVTSTADFARLGYGFEDAQGLAEVANIYAVVGDEIDSVEDASQSLISTMAAFKNEMGSLSDSDFALSIVDKFNEVDILAS